MSGADDIRERYRWALLNVRLEFNEDRSVVEFRDGAVRWTLFAHSHRPMHHQGWKIHIASSIRDAPRLFAKVVPALLARNCAFKLPASIDDAITINSGRSGRTLIGKVFPRHAANIARAMRGLDKNQLQRLGNLLRTLGMAAAHDLAAAGEAP